MLKNKSGFSLTVLIIAIAVIVIISSTAIITIKSISKDRDISNFMSDLSDVRQYVVEYMSHQKSLPIMLDTNGYGIDAEETIVDNVPFDQINAKDTGNYYYVDLSKLGKIHLADSGRGYMINEGTLNVYVRKPVNYEGTDYYTLTSDLTGAIVSSEEMQPFEIVISGNPIKWAEKAEILVSIANVKIGDEDGWNFKWLKGSHSADEFKTASSVHYFDYGETIDLTENGIYTICIESPDSRIAVRKVVITKIDDIPPVISMANGKLVIDDAETGVRTVRCKIKETTNFPINSATRQKNKEYYTARNESSTDTEKDALDIYLWDNEHIKGDTIEEYLDKYEKYYNQLTVFNRMIYDADSTSGEIANARDGIRVLNASYPQFAYNNQTFPDTEYNLVIYVDDMAGNESVFSAISREELASLSYVSANNGTMEDASASINNGARYTNDENVSVYLQAKYAKYYFITETNGASPTWDDFSSNVPFELSSEDGIKVLYVWFKDLSGNTICVTPTITLDKTPPTTEAPTVSYTNGTLSITPNQTDALSGLSGKYQYGIKESTSSSYIWYDNTSSIPALQDGKVYKIVTKAWDKAGNVSNPSDEAEISNGNPIAGNTIEVTKQIVSDSETGQTGMGDNIKLVNINANSDTSLLYIIIEANAGGNAVSIQPNSPGLTLEDSTSLSSGSHYVFSVNDNGTYKFLLSANNAEDKNLSITVNNFRKLSIGTTVIYTSNSGGEEWKIIKIDEDTNKVWITPGLVTNNSYPLSGLRDWYNGCSTINTICQQEYSSSALGLTASAMTIDDLNEICGYSPPTTFNNFVYYANNAGSGTVNAYNKTFRRVSVGVKTWLTGNDENILEGTPTTYRDSRGINYSTAVTNASRPVYVEGSYYTYDSSVIAGGRMASDQSNIARVMGNMCTVGINYGWLASTCVEPQESNTNYRIYRVKVTDSNSFSVLGRTLFDTTPKEYPANEPEYSCLIPLVKMDASRITGNYLDNGIISGLEIR